jgi:hypothetical protein
MAVADTGHRGEEKETPAPSKNQTPDTQPIAHHYTDYTNHKILDKDPRVVFGPLLLSSGEYTSSEEEALKLTLDTHFPGSVKICEWDTAKEPSLGLTVQGVRDWTLVEWTVYHNRIRLEVLSQHHMSSS